jgi:hypothetical protein
MSGVRGGEIMAEQEKTASEKLVASVALTLFSQVAMILATGLILPIALWLGARGVSTIDEISEKIDTMRGQAIETSADIRALREQANETSGELRAESADHEARVRVLKARMPRGEPAGRN